MVEIFTDGGVIGWKEVVWIEKQKPVCEDSINGSLYVWFEFICQPFCLKYSSVLSVLDQIYSQTEHFIQPVLSQILPCSDSQWSFLLLQTVFPSGSPPPVKPFIFYNWQKICLSFSIICFRSWNVSHRLKGYFDFWSWTVSQRNNLTIQILIRNWNNKNWGNQ